VRRTASMGAKVLVAIAISLASASPALAESWTGLGPIEGRLRIGRGAESSTNWSGYAAYGDTFTHAQGSWVQPAADCSSLHGRQLTLAAFWVGLDGYLSNTVEQTGTEADCEGGQPVYYAWYELYPQRLFLLPGTVEPGDVLQAKVTQSTLELEDETQGWHYTEEYLPESLQFSSAEWIAEAPFHRLTPFGSVHFSAATASVGGETPTPIGSWGNDSITLVANRGRHAAVLAEPGPLEEEGSAFSISQP
jgi:Peptidase A4 family